MSSDYYQMLHDFPTEHQHAYGRTRLPANWFPDHLRLRRGRRNSVGEPDGSYSLTEGVSRLKVLVEEVEGQPVIGYLLAPVFPCDSAEARCAEPGWNRDLTRGECGPVDGAITVAGARPVVGLVNLEHVEGKAGAVGQVEPNRGVVPQADRVGRGTRTGDRLCRGACLGDCRFLGDCRRLGDGCGVG